MKLKSTLSAFLMAFTLMLISCSHEDPASDQKNPDGALPKNEDTPVFAGDCTNVPGWASQNGGTTGGGSNAETTITTYAQLKSAIENSAVKVIKITGTITITTRLSLHDQSDKTIYGASGAKLVSTDQTTANSGIINITRCNNIIIRNLIFEGPGAYDTDGWDNAVLDDCKNVWVDHCEFRDGVDGNLDIKNKSDYITISYTKFDYLKEPKPDGPGGADDHRFSNLIGSSDNATADRGTLRITFARCWWAAGCKQRMPRVRFGKVHIINSYFNSAANDKCIMAGFEANVLIEKNVFENVTNPIDLMSGYTAVTADGNIFTNTTGNTVGGSSTAFLPPYSITSLKASAVAEDISTNAGATATGNTCGSF